MDLDLGLFGLVEARYGADPPLDPYPPAPESLPRETRPLALTSATPLPRLADPELATGTITKIMHKASAAALHACRNGIDAGAIDAESGRRPRLSLPNYEGDAVLLWEEPMGQLVSSHAAFQRGYTWLARFFVCFLPFLFDAAFLVAFYQ